jgi:SM-20-related protein
MIDILQISDFLDTDTVTEILDELSRSAGAPATVLSSDNTAGVVYQSVRRSTRIPAPARVREILTPRLLGVKLELESHFGLPLGACEEPQFLRYEEGDYFVAHQDGNTPLIYDKSRFRRISIVLFLSTPATVRTPHTYGGGALVFHGSRSEWERRMPITPPAGTLLAFRSETTHEVIPVTHGERYSIVTWFLAAQESGD